MAASVDDDGGHQIQIDRVREPVVDVYQSDDDDNTRQSLRFAAHEDTRG